MADLVTFELLSEKGFVEKPAICTEDGGPSYIKQIGDHRIEVNLIRMEYTLNAVRMHSLPTESMIDNTIWLLSQGMQ
jgi:hypothetical protein